MPYRFRVLALLFLLIFVMYLDRLCISVAGPRIQQELHLTPVQWGWVIGAFTIAYAAFEIPSGALGDRIGPRRVLTRIVLWWSVFTAATGLVRTYPVLLLVRFLFGAGEAGSFPNSALTISRWTPERERARSLSVLWVATGIGGIATPLIVVAIQKRYGWRPSFWLFGSLGILWSVVWQSWFRDRPSEKAGVPQDEIKLIGDGGGGPAQQRTMGKAVARPQPVAAHADVSLLLLGRVFLPVVDSHVSASRTETDRRPNETRVRIATGLRALGRSSGRISERPAGAAALAASGPLFHRIGLPHRSRNPAWGSRPHVRCVDGGLAARSRAGCHEWNATRVLVARCGSGTGAFGCRFGCHEYRRTDRVVSFLGGLWLYGREFRQL